jgi:pimeloyl-ACP methyl ester carboxylesterase
MNSFKLVGRGVRKVLLFPGLIGTRDAFDDMLRYADLDAFQYAVVEYRGYGHSRSEAGLLTLREVVMDAVRLVDYLCWDKFTAAGHSLGALAAQMLAVALPHRVKAIVSIAAGLSAKGASAKVRRLAFMQELAHSREKRKALVNGRTGSHYTHDASRTDIPAGVQQLDTPILVLVGEHDPNCTEAAARETTLEWYRHATLRVLKGAGHYPMFETPSATLSEIEQYVTAACAGVADQAKIETIGSA